MSEVTRVIPYGFTSRLLLAGGRSSPTSVAAKETRKMLDGPALEAGSAVRCVHSFLRRIDRRSWMPQTWFGPDTYRIDLNGIASSAVHPPSNRPVRTSQTGFQSAFGLPSSVMIWSAKPPSGLV